MCQGITRSVAALLSPCLDLVARSGPRNSFTTPPQTRKRKASEDLAGASTSKKQIKGTKAGTLSPPSLNTPPLTTMDSDDEMSGLSSQDDFGEDLDSDDGSLGEGMHSIPGKGGTKLMIVIRLRVRRRRRARCRLFAR